MVALTPRFTLLATICVLAAISSAPISDAAVLRRRALDPASIESGSTHTRIGTGSLSSRRSSHVAYGGPVLPLPKSHATSQKGYGDSSSSSDTESDEKTLSGGSQHGETDVSAGAENEDSSYEDNSADSKKGGKVNVKVRIFGPPHAFLCNRPHSFEQDRLWDPFLPLMKKMSELFSSTHNMRREH